MTQTVSIDDKKWGYAYSRGRKMITEPSTVGALTGILKLTTMIGWKPMTEKWFYDGKPIRFETEDGRPALIKGKPLKDQCFSFVNVKLKFCQRCNVDVEPIRSIPRQDNVPTGYLMVKEVQICPLCNHVLAWKYGVTQIIQ